MCEGERSFTLYVFCGLQHSCSLCFFMMDQLITRLALLWRAVSANAMRFVAVMLSISFFVYRESREEKKGHWIRQEIWEHIFSTPERRALRKEGEKGAIDVWTVRRVLWFRLKCSRLKMGWSCRFFFCCCSWFFFPVIALFCVLLFFSSAVSQLFVC